jgi:biopolymer transport protein ExbB
VTSTRDFLTLVQTGGAVMYPLLLCSIVSLAVIFERLWTLGRATSSARRLNRLVWEATNEEGLANALAIARHDTCPLASIYKAILSQPDMDDSLRNRVVHQKLASAVRGLRRNVWLVGTIGSLAPFIGLLGTVIGIVRAFEDMAATGSGGFAVVAAGISEALVATAAGLLVGVMAIFSYNAFNVRINNISLQWREWTEDLSIRVARPQPREGTLVRVVQSH